MVAARRSDRASGSRAGATIRRAVADDHAWLVDLGGRVYNALGDYRVILPSWLEQPGVLTWLDADGGRRRGFAMLGFYADDAEQAVCDLLALAVEPLEQRQGIGGALLRHVIAVAERVGPAHAIRELRLTVARDNLDGQRLYRAHAFDFAPVAATRYASGQEALRMIRILGREAP
ncbi:MAG: GNAT family N-acetyltransferase [Deltaproteobacteria bacterium]|nr:GNAT family N-acetyltransferase [Deltaproteobacteria bacterium]